MIFLTIGTHEPFDRLVRAVDSWCEATGAGPSVFGQITLPHTGSYVPRHFEWVARLDPQDFERRISAADLIISHAGMGSILTALQHGRPIVVMPRRGHLRETRNDHQFTTAHMLQGRPGLYVAENEAELPAVLNRVVAELVSAGAPPISDRAAPEFTAALRAFLLGQAVAGS